MNKIEKIKEILSKKSSIDHSISLLSWDLETEAPENATLKASKTLATLSELSYNMVVNEEFKNLLYTIDLEKLNDIDKKLILETRKNVFEIMGKIPMDEYTKYVELLTVSTRKWQEAKQKNSLDDYASYLEQVIETQKRFIKYRDCNINPYSFILNDYEPELTVEALDDFFGQIKEKLVPVILKVTKLKREKLEDIKKRFYNKKYDISKQKELSKKISDILGFSYKSGVLKESEHPFTTTIGSNKDIRITTHYYENDPISAIYSTIHEAGHGIYEQQVADIYDENFLGGGVSMGIHESQSRLFENMFGRNDNFLFKLYNLMKEYFEIDLSLEEFKLLLNECSNSLIRIEADELTYPIHIMIRYEIEKEIFTNIDKKYTAYELSNMWDDKYEKYLGIRPKNFTEGILQDVHWSQGLIGYFPSYALGSAYSAQFYNAMKKDIDIDAQLKEANFTNINEWLKEKIHKYGKFKTPKEIVKDATGEDFNPEYYISYLKEKFENIYLKEL